MATIKAVLNRDREKKHGGYSLVIQILHQRKKRVVYTPYVVTEKMFDAQLQQVAYNSDSPYSKLQIKEINIFLSNKIEQLNNIVHDMVLQNVDFTAEDIVRKYRLQQSDSYLVTYIENRIHNRQNIGKDGTAKALISTLRSLRKFIGRRELKFIEITPQLVREYENFMTLQKLGANTIAFYMRNFKSIYNSATEDGIEMFEHYPFRKISMKGSKTIKRALKHETIQSIATAQLNSPIQSLARDIFMFSFYARGMSFIDIAMLTHEHIEGRFIYYERSKTKQLLKIAITPDLKRLIAKYHSNSSYLFPLIDPTSEKSTFEQYKIGYGRIHNGLKGVAALLDLKMPLTMHVARHSWATIAKELGTSTVTISEGLGHTSEKTTKIYLKEFDQTVIDLVNKKISRLIQNVSV